MKIIMLSSQECENKNGNNGDCFVIDDGNQIVLYDCGCEEYAKWVVEYMDKNGYDKIKIVLSHNDDDHFKGIPYLVEQNRVSEITTVLLLKYVDELLDIIDDGRKNRDSLKKQILEKYDNISKLSGSNLQDAFTHIEITDKITILGPSKEYILNAAAKGLDTTEGDIIDGETITNATSIHLGIENKDIKILLTGDSNFESVNQERLSEYRVIQLPHHGKKKIAEEIFEKLEDVVEEVFLISDNTGSSNGGSDDLDYKGYDVRNTKDSGTIIINYDDVVMSRKRTGSLNEIHNSRN